MYFIKAAPPTTHEKPPLYAPHSPCPASQVDEPAKSWFAFKDPRTGKVHRRPDRTGKINMFRVTKGQPFWHTIYSATNRWSYGTVLSDRAAGRIMAQLEGNRKAVPRLLAAG